MESTLHKLVLGTVQFGLDYGINNFLGKPSREKSLEMLGYAFGAGIKTFDTAYAYGDAEEILGEFSQKNNLEKKINVITKLKPNILSEEKGSVYDIVAGNLHKSLERLKFPAVDGYLLHTPEYVKNYEVVDALSRLKKEGMVKNIGVSIYEEEDALYAAQLKEVDYIQIPYNIFDQRLDRTDFFQLAKKGNKKVFARSAFLQGLFFMDEKKIPSHLENAKVHLHRLDKIISKYNISRQKAAFLFSLMNDDIDYVVFGVDSLQQLKENIETSMEEIQFEDCMDELKNEFLDIEKNIIFPSLWKK